MRLNIIAISYAKRALDPLSRERARMQEYADVLGLYHVIVFTHKDEGFPAVQQDKNLTLYATNSKSKIGMLARAFRLGRAILSDQQNVNFIISSQDPFETSLIGRLLTFNTQHLHQVQIHGDVFNKASYRFSLLQRVRVMYGRYVVKRARKIRVVSKRIKRSLLEIGVSDEVIVVLPVQANLQRFLEVGKNRTYDELHGGLRLLYVGRLAPEKNLQLLLDVCAKLRKQSVPFTLKLVGDGSEKERLQAHAVRMGVSDHVTFPGWTNAVMKEMQSANVFCLTSNHEGWAMVLQEAAASGLAIITTDVGCADEFISKDKECVIVPVGDTTGYFNQLMKLNDVSERTRLGRAAYQKALTTSVPKDTYLSQWVASHLTR